MIETTIKIAGVRFHENWKVYDFDATDIDDVAVGDKVIIDSDRGLDVALVVRMRRTQEPPAVEAPSVESPPPVEQEVELSIDGEEEIPPAEAAFSPPAVMPSRALRKVLRKATEDDLVREKKNRAREAEAFGIAQGMITERNLPMKLIRAEYSFDASRATFFFFSETRVDFRELVKDLAHKLKSRIEMRQIGVRDVARMIGGFGPCGRELCCSAFLKNFEPVSIRMAKKQEMILNPAKISGVCGRLLCCLSYEFGMYDENKKDLAGMREAKAAEKKLGEEQRIAEDRKVADEDRAVEEKRQREDRRQQDQQRGKPREGGQKAGDRTERKKDQRPEKKAQQPERMAQQPRPPRESRQPKPEEQPPQQQDQNVQQPQQQEGAAAAAKKKRRKFWRKKKKGQQQGESSPPQGPGGA